MGEFVELSVVLCLTTSACGFDDGAACRTDQVAVEPDEADAHGNTAMSAVETFDAPRPTLFTWNDSDPDTGANFVLDPGPDDGEIVVELVADAAFTERSSCGGKPRGPKVLHVPGTLTIIGNGLGEMGEIEVHAVGTDTGWSIQSPEDEAVDVWPLAFDPIVSGPHPVDFSSKGYQTRFELDEFGKLSGAIEALLDPPSVDIVPGQLTFTVVIPILEFPETG